MAIRHRKFRKIHCGVTPYMLWILSGVALGFKVQHDERQKRMMKMEIGDDEIYIHSTAVVSLVLKNFLSISESAKEFKLTPAGFELAHDRLKQSGRKPKSPNKKISTQETLFGEIDSSTYVG